MERIINSRKYIIIPLFTAIVKWVVIVFTWVNTKYKKNQDATAYSARPTSRSMAPSTMALPTSNRAMPWPTTVRPSTFGPDGPADN